MLSERHHRLKATTITSLKPLLQKRQPGQKSAGVTLGIEYGKSITLRSCFQTGSGPLPCAIFYRPQTKFGARKVWGKKYSHKCVILSTKGGGRGVGVCTWGGGYLYLGGVLHGGGGVVGIHPFLRKLM